MSDKEEHLSYEGARIFSEEIKTRLKAVTEMPETASNDIVRLYIGEDTANYKKGHIYQAHAEFICWKFDVSQEPGATVPPGTLFWYLYTKPSDPPTPGEDEKIWYEETPRHQRSFELTTDASNLVKNNNGFYEFTSMTNNQLIVNDNQVAYRDSVHDLNPVWIDITPAVDNNNKDYDEHPIENSEALITSGGIYNSITKINKKIIKKPIELSNVRSVIKDSDTIYAGAYDSGFYKLVNGGELELLNNNYDFRWIRCSLKDGNNIYVGTQDYLYKSTNSGKTFEEENVYDVRVLLKDGNDVYAGTRDCLYKSTNGGSFERMEKNYFELESLLKDGDNFYIGDGESLYKFDGNTYKRLCQDHPTHSILKKDNDIYVCSYEYIGEEYQGLFKLGEEIEDNTQLIPVAKIGHIYSLAKDDKGNIYAGTDNGAYAIKQQGEIYISELISEIGSIPVYSLFEDKDTIYAGTQNGVYSIKQQENSEFVSELIEYIKKELKIPVNNVDEMFKS